MSLLRPATRLARTAPRAFGVRALSIASSSRPSVVPRIEPRTLSPTSWMKRMASSTPHGDPGVAPGIAVRDLTDDEYHDLADADMDTMHESLEVLCEEHGPEDWEVEYSSGVMTLTVPPTGIYVINKQPPNHQIWVSSPVSGPSRYSLSPEGVWVHHRREGVKLGELLSEELKQLLEQAGGEAGWEGVGLKA